MSELMDRMTVKEKFVATSNDELFGVEIGVGEDDPFLYISLEVAPEDSSGPITHMLIEFGIGPQAGESIRSFTEKLRRLIYELERQAIV